MINYLFQLLWGFKLVLIKTAATIGTILTIFWEGKKTCETHETKKELNDLKETVKFKQKLDSVSIADKREYLRTKFSKKKINL